VIKRLKNTINIYIRRSYASIFSSNKLLIKFNKLLLDLCLSALGYGNWRGMMESGEDFFIKKYLSNNQINLCLDVGANIGNYSKLLLEETNSKVISFEPIPFNFKRLSDNLSDYSDRAILVNKGISNKSGTLEINYNENLPSFASFVREMNHHEYIHNNETLEIEVISIDDFIRENQITEIDFIKIDVEGFEYEVIEGAFETFNSIKPKYVQIEYGWHQLIRNYTLNYFAEKLSNYNVYQLTYNNMKLVDPKDSYANFYLYSNFVFIRKDIDQ
jgi:FkbM family methyltransferase